MSDDKRVPRLMTLSEVAAYIDTHPQLSERTRKFIIENRYLPNYSNLSEALRNSVKVSGRMPREEYARLKRWVAFLGCPEAEILSDAFRAWEVKQRRAGKHLPKK